MLSKGKATNDVESFHAVINSMNTTAIQIQLSMMQKDAAVNAVVLKDILFIFNFYFWFSWGSHFFSKGYVMYYMQIWGLHA